MMGLAKTVKYFWVPKKGGKLLENLMGFNFTPKILFHEFVRQLTLNPLMWKIW
jgi:hypothetical protein